MLELAKSIKAAGTCEFVSVMGYRDAQTFLLDEFKEQGDCYVATEDGSVGAKGNVLDAMKEYKLNADSNVKNKRICKEGPVFLAEEVDL